MKRLIRYLNPLAHLGERKYSLLFPLCITLLFCVLSEFFAYVIVKNPMIVGVYAIFIPAALIVYFAFREGILGGCIATLITISYYFYIIDTRHYAHAQLDSGIETSLTLAALYLGLALIIGWLKQTIDRLFEREADERHRLEAIIQQLPVGILITDHTGRLMHQNSQVEHVLGKKFPTDFTFGTDEPVVKGMINGKVVQPTDAPIAHVISKGKAIERREYLIERKDGKVRTVEVSASPIKNKQGKLIAAAEIIADITRQKELERQKDEFLSIASHELKTPVTSLKAYGQVLHSRFSKAGDEKSATMLGKMDAQINKLTNLIQDLLDISKIEGGRLQFHNEKFQFDELISEIVEEIQRTTVLHTIQIKGKTKTSFYGDRERLGQVVTNFLTNAVKYSPHSEKILVQVSADKKNIQVCVQDFGVGIPKDKLTHVFERFYRVPGKTHETVPGMGIGLYISSEIVKRQGGKIWAESTEKKGSKFFFSLPLDSKKRMQEINTLVSEEMKHE